MGAHPGKAKSDQSSFELIAYCLLCPVDGHRFPDYVLTLHEDVETLAPLGMKLWET